MNPEEIFGFQNTVDQLQHESGLDSDRLFLDSIDDRAPFTRGKVGVQIGLKLIVQFVFFGIRGRRGYRRCDNCGRKTKRKGKDKKIMKK
jgi:hypothetical protein